MVFKINDDNDIRYIDWVNHEGASPSILRISDYENITNSRCLFARKSDQSVEKAIIEKCQL